MPMKVAAFQVCDDCIDGARFATRQIQTMDQLNVAQQVHHD
jgi:predicted metal-binding protein